jgi:hypothetical protein
MTTSKKLKTTKVAKVKAVTKVRVQLTKPKLKTLLINKKIIMAYDHKNKSYKLSKVTYDHFMGDMICLIQSMNRETCTAGVPLEIEDIVLQIKYKYGKGVEKDMRLMMNGSHRNAWKRPKDPDYSLSPLR